MKIVYITNDNSVTTTKNGYTGVMKKVISQISEMRALGMESELLILNENLPESLPKEIDIRFRKAKGAPYKNIWVKIRSSSEIAEAIGKEIEASDGSTVIYIRGLVPTPKLVRALRKRRKCLVVFELQSFAEREAAFLTRFLKGINEFKMCAANLRCSVKVILECCLAFLKYV